MPGETVVRNNLRYRAYTGIGGGMQGQVMDIVKSYFMSCTRKK